MIHTVKIKNFNSGSYLFLISRFFGLFLGISFVDDFSLFFVGK